MRSERLPYRMTLPSLAGPRFLLLLPCLWLAGCQVLQPPTTLPPVIERTPSPPATAPAQTAPPTPATEPYRNVYTQEKDSAPDPGAPAIDHDSLEEPLPKPESRSRYGNKSPYYVNGRRYEVLTDEKAQGYRAEGMASWYGKKFHGFRTSSMEPYDMHALTAAHTSLPIPAYVRVTNLENQRSVVVRVNDRGPFHAGRLIDLSWAAAKRLGYTAQGTARVRVEALALPHDPSSGEQTASATTPPAPTPAYFVQFGAFSFPDAANRHAEAVRGALGENPQVERGDDYVYRVRLGPFTTREAAVRLQEQARESGFGESSLVTRP